MRTGPTGRSTTSGAHAGRGVIPALVALAILVSACGRAGRASAPRPHPAGGEVFVFSTESGATTQFWLADPAKPSVRRLLGSAPHAPDWSGSALISPDGRMLAYTLLPPGSRDPDHGAQLVTLGLTDGRAQVVAAGVDLRSTLVWTNDSSAVTFQSYDATGEQLWLQPSSGGPGKLLAEATNGERILPIAALRDSVELLAARYTRAGVDLVSVAPGSQARSWEHLTDGVARDLVLDSAGSSLAFIATGAASGPAGSRGYVAALGGDVQALPAAWGEIVGVAWSPSGTLVAGSAGPDAGLYLLDGGRLRAAVSTGFAQPLAWSPSGRYLALRLFSGASAEQPGSARDVIRSPDGRLSAITDSAPVRFIGWLGQGA